MLYALLTDLTGHKHWPLNNNNNNDKPTDNGVCIV